MDDLGLQYMSSLYWSLTALVKVPWVAPTTVVEKLYGGLTVMLGAIFFAALLGKMEKVDAIIEAVNSLSAKRLEQAAAFEQAAREGEAPVLVTSAAHMPRSRWCFEQNGIEVIAAPVGFLGGHNARPLNGWLPESKAFWQNGLLLNEVVGMAVYPLVYRSANE